MKCIITVIVLALAHNAWSFMSSDVLKYAEHVVHKISINEWDDCIVDVASTNEIAIAYPTLESVFGDVSGGGLFSEWTAIEKRAAFNQFLDELGKTNSVMVSARYRRIGSYALLLCSQKNYTNALSSAMSIIRNSDAPCCASAIDVVQKLGHPSMDMNLVMLMVATNKANRVSAYKRCSALREYLSKLDCSEEDQRSVAIDAARLFYAHKGELENLVDFDRMLCRTFADYTQSSNRLEVALTAIDSSIVTDEVRDYFRPVTNFLLSSSIQLRYVNGL